MGKQAVAMRIRIDKSLNAREFQRVADEIEQTGAKIDVVIKRSKIIGAYVEPHSHRKILKISGVIGVIEDDVPEAI